MPAAWQFGNGNANGVALNNGATMLAGDASCTISNAASLNSPTSPRFQILIDSEIIEVDAVAANVYSSLLRGQEGTAAASHAATATVFLPITASMLTGAFLRADATNAVEVTGTDFKASGPASLGSATTGRYIGAWTTTGAPTGLTAQLDDFGYDGQQRLWVCTVAGTPGTWIALPKLDLASTFTALQTFSAGITVTGADATAPTFKASGAASLGSVQTGRYIGNWTTNGAPTGLTAQVADHGFDGNGNLWYCTVAGTPGTWRPFGTHTFDEQTVAAVATITIPVSGNLAAQYRNIKIKWKLKTSSAVTVENLTIRFNASAVANYVDEYVSVLNGAVTGVEDNTTPQAQGAVGIVTGTSAPANTFAAGEVTIYDIGSATDVKNWTFIAIGRRGTGASGMQTQSGGGTWVIAPVAITTITLLATGNLSGVVTTEGTW